MVRPSKFRPPYETYGIPRDRVERDHPDFLQFGWMETPEEAGKDIRDRLDQIGFKLVPKSGWPTVGREIQLIHLMMTGMEPAEKGNAQLARECKALSQKIDKIAFDLSRLGGSPTMMAAAVFTLENCTEHTSSFFKTARSLDMIAAWLTVDRQPTKWATTRRREARLVLACKLAPFFEKEFNGVAQPRGGSEAWPIEQEADWTKFFQVIASLLLHENATPDRQTILWEAARPSEIGS